MCVLYVSFGSKVRPRTFGCIALGCEVFILRSILLLYSAGSVVNRVQVVLHGFSVRLFSFVQAKTLCRYGCMYFLATLMLVCVDHDLNQCTWWWYVCNVNGVGERIPPCGTPVFY